MEPTHCLICKKGPLKNVRRHMWRQHRARLGWDDMLDIDPTGKSGFWVYIYE